MTSTPFQKLVKSILSAIEEHDKSERSKRIKEGIKKAKQKQFSF